MKLYDGGRAPNPRRTRIFLAEKEISCRSSRSTLAPCSTSPPAYAAVNPLHAGAGAGARRRHGDHGIDRDLPLLRGASSRSAAVRARRLGDRAGSRCGTGVSSCISCFRCPHVFRNSHPAMKEMEVPQVPAWAEANKPRILEFIALLDARAEASPVRRGRRILGRRHYRPRRRRLHEAGEARGAGRAHAISSAGTPTFPRGRARRPDACA